MVTLEFNCTNNVQTTTLPKGKYKFQIWGAQGGGNENTDEGGRGGYSWCYYTLKKAATLNIYVGCRGEIGRKNTTFGGGGLISADRGTDNAGSGGGGTDIRTGTSLDTRILVAGGGGGGKSRNNGGFGGGTKGGDGTGWVSDYRVYGLGGTDSSGGDGGYYYLHSNYKADNGTLGNGGKGIGDSFYGGGGGGGYYGGGGSYESSGGGGSGFVDPRLNGKTISGDQVFIQPDNTYSTGKTGNGYAMITLLDLCSKYRIKPYRTSFLVYLFSLTFVS